MTKITQVLKRIREWVCGPYSRGPSIYISTKLWQQIMAELALRGLGGKRESGAFLLANRTESENWIERVAYYDDLDPDCLKGYIHFRGLGYSRLWDFCESENLRVIADVHTHPNSWVGQSCTDQRHPMIARPGHIALIVPAYATRPVRTHAVGVHLYQGDDGWKSWLGSKAELVFKIKRHK